jgi:hypothetical protein
MADSLRGSSSGGAPARRHSARLSKQPPLQPADQSLAPPPAPFAPVSEDAPLEEPPSSQQPPQAPPAPRAVPGIVRNLNLPIPFSPTLTNDNKMTSPAATTNVRSFSGDSAFKAQEYSRAVADKLEPILRVNGTSRHSLPIKQQLDMLGAGLPQQAETGRWQDLITGPLNTFIRLEAIQWACHDVARCTCPDVKPDAQSTITNTGGPALSGGPLCGSSPADSGSKTAPVLPSRSLIERRG